MKAPDHSPMDRLSETAQGVIFISTCLIFGIFYRREKRITWIAEKDKGERGPVVSLIEYRIFRIIRVLIDAFRVVYT